MTCKDKKVIDILICGMSIFMITIIILNSNFITSLDGDNAPQTYALYTLVGRALHNFELPLWNPYVWSGLSNIGAPITEAFYPINWLLSYLFYNKDTEIVSYAIIPANLIIHVSLWFIGMFFLQKRIGVKPIWAMLLTFLSICCYGFVSYFTWIVFFNGFAWFPLMTLSAISLIEAEDINKIYINIVVLGILFFLEASISISLMLVITSIFIVLLFIVYGIYYKRVFRTMFFKIFFSGMVGILLASPMILCTIHFLINSARYVDDNWLYGLSKVSWKSFSAHKVSNLDVENFINVISVTQHSWLSFGGILVIFAVIGIFGKRIIFPYMHKWCIIVFAYSLLYCLGFLVPDFAYYIPFLNNLREMFMYGCMVLFSITILAGYGIVNICKEQNCDEGVEEYHFDTALFYSIELCLIYNLFPHRYYSFLKILISICLIIAILMIYEKKFKKIALFLVGICSVACIGVFLQSFHSNNMNEKEAISQIQYVNKYNKTQFNSFITDKDARIIQVGESAYPTNQGIALGIKEEINYFNPSSEISIKSHNNIDFVKRSQLHNVKYWLMSEKNEESFFDWWNLAYPDISNTEEKVDMLSSWTTSDKSEVYIYESDVTFGNGWVVSNVEFYDKIDEEKIFSLINNPETKLNEVVYVNKDKLSQKDIDNLLFKDSNNGDYEVKTINYKNNSIMYEVSSENAGVLITSEIYDSGWKVYVNGQKQTMLNVDFSNRGVEVPEGKSIVKFVYRPTGFVVGVIFQIVTLISLVLGLFYFQKHQNN